MRDFDPDTRDAGKCGYIGDGRDSPCGLAEGWGYENATRGFCSHHGERGGTEGNDGGAPEDNTNAIKHALFAQRSRFYRKVMDNLDRQVCDDIYRGTVEEYRAKNGDPSTRDLHVMWTMAVEHIHFSYADDWYADRPRSLKSGNPMVDRETRYTEGGEEYHKYKEAVTTSTKLKVRREHRAWLKDNNMTNDPDSQKADALADGIDLSLSSEDKDALDAAFGDS